MEQRKLQVFVSSTFNDMKLERQAAVTAVLEAGHIPAGMELFSAGDSEQLKIIENWIDQSDVYMLILGGRYGSIEPVSKRSYIECEYRYALSKGKRVFSMVISEELLTQKVSESGLAAIERESTEKYNEFRAFVLSKMCGIISSLPELQKEILKSLAAIANDNSLLGWVRPSKNTVLQVGNFRQYFYPFLDPMTFKIGRVVKSQKRDNTSSLYVLRESFHKTGNIRWVYGPYRTLPCTGKYTTTFRIRLDNKDAIPLPHDKDIIVVDVYDYYGGLKSYAVKTIKISELDNLYKDFIVEFQYTDISTVLEYRVGVLDTSFELTISCDRIMVTRRGSDDL